MEDDVSNSVEVIEIEMAGENSRVSNEDMPIIALFKRLIRNDNKENTVLTNAQIIDILQKEFEMNIEEMHELKLDIYLNILKKFLKDWPQWDEFDQVVNDLKTRNETAELQKYITFKHKSLREYLRTKLTAAEKHAEEVVNSAQEKVARKNNQLNSIKSDVYMEINCTRTQLNNLFFKHPIPELNDTIFNIAESGPSKITIDILSLEAILNWFNVCLVINLPRFSLKREMIHDLNHMLVNNKLNIKKEIKLLDTCLEEKLGNKPRVVELHLVLITINSILTSMKSTDYGDVGNYIFKIILKDLNEFPVGIKVPCCYRKYLNKYPYVRNLCVELPSNRTNYPTNPSEVLIQSKNICASAKYDLRLEETVYPRYLYTIQKIDTSSKKILQKSNDTMILVECKSCGVRFSGIDLLHEVRQHFLDFHNNEPDWGCMNCQQTFTMSHLASKRWFHKCATSV